MNLPNNGVISQHVRDGILASREEWPVHSNRASEIGNPCHRYLYYMRTAYKERPLPDVGLLEIFKEGNYQERATVELLSEHGVELNQQQRSIDLKAYEISGSIDGSVHPRLPSDFPDWPLEENGSQMWVPAEIKSMSPWIWESINTYEDIINSDKHWIRKYPSQLQVYLWGMEKPVGVLILKNKVSCRLKDIWVPLDYELGNEIMEKAKAVNKAIAKGEAPERTESAVCRQCPFSVICQPLIVTGAGAEMFDDPELEEALDLRELHAVGKSAYDRADRALKKIMKDREAPEMFICGDWFSQGTVVEKKAFEVKASSYIKRKFSRISTTEEDGEE